MRSGIGTGNVSASPLCVLVPAIGFELVEMLGEFGKGDDGWGRGTDVVDVGFVSVGNQWLQSSTNAMRKGTPHRHPPVIDVPLSKMFNRDEITIVSSRVC